MPPESAREDTPAAAAPAAAPAPAAADSPASLTTAESARVGQEAEQLPQQGGRSQGQEHYQLHQQHSHNMLMTMLAAPPGSAGADALGQRQPMLPLLPVPMTTHHHQHNPPPSVARRLFAEHPPASRAAIEDFFAQAAVVSEQRLQHLLLNAGDPRAVHDFDALDLPRRLEAVMVLRSQSNNSSSSSSHGGKT